MVFKNLYLIRGVILNKAEVKTFLKIDSDNKLFDEFAGFFPIKQNDMKIYQYRCCSQLYQEHFIVGYSIKKYHRKYVDCDNDCSLKKSVCDNCIGETENGHYDVEKIMNQVIECDIKNICKECAHDNKQSVFGKCSRCNRNETDLKGTSWINSQIENNIVKKLGKLKSDIKCFYMLDDCLSCS